MFSSLNKIINMYFGFITKLLTYIGLTMVYTFGISLGLIFFKILKPQNTNKWHKSEQTFNPETMY